MESSESVFGENDSKISGTYTWENSPALTGTPTVKYSLGSVLASASLGSHFPFLVGRCPSQRIWADSSLVSSSLPLVVHWT